MNYTCCTRALLSKPEVKMDGNWLTDFLKFNFCFIEIVKIHVLKWREALRQKESSFNISSAFYTWSLDWSVASLRATKLPWREMNIECAVVDAASI